MSLIGNSLISESIAPGEVVWCFLIINVLEKAEDVYFLVEENKDREVVREILELPVIHKRKGKTLSSP